jgi:hypothetical protein
MSGGDDGGRVKAYRPAQTDQVHYLLGGADRADAPRRHSTQHAEPEGPRAAVDHVGSLLAGGGPPTSAWSAPTSSRRGSGQQNNAGVPRNKIDNVGALLGGSEKPQPPPAYKKKEQEEGVGYLLGGKSTVRPGSSSSHGHQRSMSHQREEDMQAIKNGVPRAKVDHVRGIFNHQLG